MTRFIVSRLVQFPLILAAIYLITFFMAWVVPGDPFLRNDKNLSPEALLKRREEFHAQNWKTFLGYYSGRVVLHADFGRSMEYEEWTVNDILRSALPVSITMGLFALVVALVGGIGLGTVAAVRRDGVLDWLSLSIALIGISLPSFVAAAVLFISFVAKLHLFPVGEWGHVRNLVLPGIALALLPMAYIARLTRVSMLDTLGNDYVRTARAKGLSRGLVVWKHALRNALLPVLSYLGPAAAYALTGSFVVEKVFAVPGLGQHFVNSILNRDRTLILGTVIVYSFFLLLFNLLVDIGYAFVDPRIDVTASKPGVA
jgi:oligopeptide transport system permease protein